MKFLNYINEHLIIYLYIIAIIILIAFSFRLYKEIKNTLKEIKIFKTQGEKIKNQLSLINEKTARIKYTMTNSLPLFIQITLVINFIKSLFSKKARKRKDFVRKTSEAVSAISPLINMIKYGS